jgi:hypothetical protein
MKYLEIVVSEQISEHEERRIATVRVFENGGVAAFERRNNRKTVAKVRAKQAGESMWRVVERVAATMAKWD